MQERGTKLVLEQVVTTIASVADTAEEQFVTFYDRLGFQIYFLQGGMQNISSGAKIFLVTH